MATKPEVAERRQKLLAGMREEEGVEILYLDALSARAYLEIGLLL